MTLQASTKHIVRYVNQALNLLNLYHRCANEHYVLPRQRLSYTHRIEANLSKRDSKMTTSRAAEIRSFMRSSAAGWIGLVLAALMSTIYAAWFASRPLYNWDMIPYVAIALLDAGHPADSLRQKTYEIMERGSPVSAHEFLFGGSEYKKDTYNRGADFRYMVAHDLKIFADILPFYVVKPVYPALMSLLVRAGISPVAAARPFPALPTLLFVSSFTFGCPGG